MNQPLDLGRLGIIDRNRTEHQLYSRETATRFVIEAVESTGAATRDDFDVERIVSTAHAMVNDWNITSLQPDAFWRIASTYIKE